MALDGSLSETDFRKRAGELDRLIATLEQETAAAMSPAKMASARKTPSVTGPKRPRLRPPWLQAKGFKY